MIRFAVLFCALALPLMAAGQSTEVLLAADFDDKPLGAPIGTGGPVLGEPLEVQSQNRTEIVASGDGRALRVTREHTFSSATYMRWGFLDGREVNSGILRIETLFTPNELGAFFMRTRERDGSTTRWIDVEFAPSGNIQIQVRTGAPQTVTTYVAGETLAISLVGDFDAGTYGLHINGTQQASGSFAPTALGVGLILIGTTSLASNDGKSYELDDLLVEWTAPAPLFVDGFED